MKEAGTAVALALASAAFGAAFFLTSTLDVPLLWFDPVLGQASFGHRPSPVAIDWFGRTLLSSMAALIVFGAALFVANRRDASAFARMAIGWSCATFVLAASLYAAGLYGRRAEPEPLPSWYQPR